MDAATVGAARRPSIPDPSRLGPRQTRSVGALTKRPPTQAHLAAEPAEAVSGLCIKDATRPTTPTNRRHHRRIPAPENYSAEERLNMGQPPAMPTAPDAKRAVPLGDGP